MSFLQEELVNFAAKGWLGILGTGDRNTAPDNLAWYEEVTTIDVIVKPSQIWGDYNLLLPAATLGDAQANAITLSGIIEDYSDVANAIHLTPSANSKVFFATEVYGDLQTRLYNWIMPQLIPRIDPGWEGFPSIGYMIRLYQGNPALPGAVEIPTTAEKVSGVPGWFMNFGAGAIKVASSFVSVTDPSDIWMTGFRYIGAEGGGGSSSPDDNFHLLPFEHDPELIDETVIYDVSVGAYRKTLIGDIRDRVNRAYQTIADLELASARDNVVVYCAETETAYRYESNGPTLVRDGFYILDTGDGGDSRWIAIAGQYMAGDLNLSGVLDLMEQVSAPSPLAGYIRAFAYESPGNDIFTQLLLHFNNGEGSSVFDDSSSYNHPVTAHNGITQAESVQKFGESCGGFDGIDDFLTIPQVDFNLLTDDFAIDTWVYLTDTREHIIYSHASDTSNYLKLYVTSTQQLALMVVVAGITMIDIRGGYITPSLYTFVALQRDGSNWYLYVEGLRVATASSTTSLNFSNDPQIGSTSLVPLPGELMDNLYGYWKLDENAGVNIGDSSGNGRTGTLNVGTWVAGQLGSALQFTGIATNYVDMGSIASFENNEAWSMSCWFLTSAGGLKWLMSKCATGAWNVGYRIGLNGGNIRVEIRNADANRIMVTDSIGGRNDGVWHHLVVTYSGTRIATDVRIYVDGAAVPYTVNNNTLISSIINAAPFNISGINNGASNRWNGSVDDCALWYSRVLTPDDVTELYNSGSGRYVDEATASYFMGYMDEFRMSISTVRFQDAIIGKPEIPYGMVAPYWVLPDGSIVGLKDLGFIGSRQWGEDGDNLYRETGRVDVYNELGSGAEDILVRNMSGFEVQPMRAVRVTTYDPVNNIPHVIQLDGLNHPPIGITRGAIPDNNIEMVVKRGVIPSAGLNTLSSELDDPVFVNMSGELTLVDTSLRVGSVVSLNANGAVYIDLTGTASGIQIAAEDEDIEIAPQMKRINFIGTGVSAYQDIVDPTQVNVYIPPIVFAPDYNSTNSVGDAVVDDVATSLRNVSDPTIEGTPFNIGDWTAGLSYPCLHTGSLSYTHTDPCSFKSLTSIIEVNVYDADGTTVLAQHLTSAITGNIDVTVNNIRIQVTGWAADYFRHKANIGVTVNIGSILGGVSGRFTVEIIHHNGSDYTKTQSDVFLDTEPQAQALTGLTMSETGGGVVTRFLSGIEYYTTDSLFTVNIADIDYMNSDSYPDPFIQIDGSEYGLPNLNLGPGNLTGWTVKHDDVDDTYQNTAWGINAANMCGNYPNANVHARPVDWVPGAWIDSPDFPMLINTYSLVSTATIERFHDEQWRCPVTGNFDLTNQRSWDSTIDVGASDAVFRCGGCERNITNWQSYNPNPLSQPDYSSSQNATVYLIREFKHNGSASSGFTLTIAGSYTSIELKLAKAWDGTANGGTVWVNMASAYNAPQWNNGNPLGGSGSLTGGSHHTFGTNNIVNTGDTMYIRIGFTGTQRITSLSVVFD